MGKGYSGQSKAVDVTPLAEYAAAKSLSFKK